MSSSSVTCRFVVYAPLPVLLVVLLPALGAAQEPVKSFDQLSTRLKPGDTIYVTDAQGREVKGKIGSLDATSLSLTGDAGVTFRAGEALTIVQRWPDSLVNGVIIGFVSGLAMATGVMLYNCGEEYQECDYSRANNYIWASGGAGAGIGAAVDALRRSPKRVIYRASGTAATASASLSMSPVITPRAKGVVMSCSF